MTTFIFGGFMREQVCIYMCPWPRIQTAMLDEKSLIVTYKDWRGEPRTHAARRAPSPVQNWRLHRLQPVRCGLPHRHRHPRRAANRLHHLRAVHRRLRQRDGPDWPPARPDRLLHWMMPIEKKGGTAKPILKRCSARAR
jgi:hypothetical protein